MANLYWTAREARDAAFTQFFAARKDCSKFDCLPNDNGMSDGTFELANLREGYYIDVPANVREAWMQAQRARDARGLKGPAHKTAREVLYHQILDAAR